MTKAMRFDNVPVKYRGNKRASDNFIHSNCLVIDVDNNHSEEPQDWVTVDNIKTGFPNVPFYAVYSRNHNKEKNGAKARPKFHLYFPIEKMTDTKRYKSIKDNLCACFSAFDFCATDNARFFFGVVSPQVEYVDGNVTIEKFLQC